MALSAVFGIASAQESEFPSSDAELFSASVQLNAVPEGPALDWQRCLGGSMTELLNSIQKTGDGGYITAGYAYSYDGDVSGHHGGWTDAWVVKLDSGVTLQWQQCFGGTGDDSAWGIIQTNDGGYSIAGRTTSDNGDFSGNHGSGDAWVVKINLDRETEWQQCLGGSGDDTAYSIQQTGDSGFIIAGETYSDDGNVSGNHGGGDAWIVKLDTNGTLQWQQCLGGSGYDNAKSIRETGDGGYIITGETFSNDGDAGGNHGGGDVWVVKVNSGGTLQWQQCLGGAGGDKAYSIQKTGDGGYIIAGGTSSNDGDAGGNHGGGDAWVVKLSSGGTLQWQQCLGGTSGDTAYSIEPAEGGGYLIAGETHSDDGDVSGKHGKWDGWVVKLDSGGTPEWQRCLGGSEGDSLRSIVQISDGIYITAGVTFSNDGDVSGSHGSGDFWVAKFAPESDVKKPDAGFSADKTTGTSPLTVNFTDLSKNNATSWNWSFGDGGISEIQNPVHTYTSAGNYTVSLTVSNDAGADTETKTDYIIVTAPEPCQATFYLNQNLVADTEEDILSSGSYTGAYNYFLSIVNEEIFYAGDLSTKDSAEDNNSERVLVRPEFSMDIPGFSEYITGYAWPDYASTAGDRICWKFPESFNIGVGEGLSTSAQSSKTDEMELQFTISRAFNRTFFEESGVQHLEFSVVFANLSFTECWGRISYPDSGNVTASKIPYSIICNAPVTWEFGKESDQFVFDVNRLSSGTEYNFSVDIDVKTYHNVTYKPEVFICTVTGNESRVLNYGRAATVPADMLPVYISNATAGSETGSSWRLLRKDNLRGTLKSFIEEIPSARKRAEFPGVQWQLCLGGTGIDHLYSIEQTGDGGYIATGFTNSSNGDVSGNHGGADVWVVKLDSGGTLQWQRCLGGTGAERGYDIEQTGDGGYIITGSTTSDDGDVSGHHGVKITEGTVINSPVSNDEDISEFQEVSDFWVVKLDSGGNLQWQHCLGGWNYDESYSLCGTGDGGFIIAGVTYSEDGDVTGNHGLGDFWVVKLDSAGTLKWQRCLGGSGADYAYSITQTDDECYIITGFTGSNDGDVSGCLGVCDAWTVKLDSAGNLQWQRCTGGSYGELASSIIQTDDGGYITAGESYTYDGDVFGHGALDFWAVKMDSDGYSEWQRCLGGVASDSAYSIQQSGDGGYILAGETHSNETFSDDGDVTGNHGGYDAWVVKVDFLGFIEWQRCLGGSDYDYAKCIRKTDDGGYIVAGYTESNDGDVSGNHGDYDGWVVKIAPESGIISPDADFSSDKTTGTSPLAVNFSDLSTGGPESWNWSFGDGGLSTVRNPVYTYSSAGNYTVSLTVSNDAGYDTETKTEYIIVYPKGDFNHNGVVDIGDASKVAYMLVKIVPEDPGADFNFNGFVDIGDVSKIAYYIAGKTGGL